MGSFTDGGTVKIAPRWRLVSTQQERWQRLHEIAVKRSRQLGYHRQSEIPGVSPAWLRELRNRTEPATPRQHSSMESLDKALRWDVGTSLRLSRDDFTPGSPVALDEEDRLVSGGLFEGSKLTLAEQIELLDFETVVLARLRDLPQRQRESVMGRITRLLEINPNG